MTNIDPEPPMTTPPSASTICTAHTTAGNPCRAPAVRGATVCSVHGGRTPQVIRAAARNLARQAVAVVVAKEAGRLGKPIPVAPEIALLDLVFEAAGNVALLGRMVARLADPGDALEDGSEGMWTVTPFGVISHPAITMYDSERDRLAKFSELAIRANLGDRLVKLEEARAVLLVGIIERVLASAELGLPSAVQAVGRRLVAGELRAVSAVDSG